MTEPPQSLICANTVNELMWTARNCPPGNLVEVGVYKGGSAAALAEVAKEQGRKLFLYDTFTGIPYSTPGVDHHIVGDFSDTSIEQVRAAIPSAIIRQGIFPDTLTDEVGGIALAHIDCDQYASVHACCVRLAPYMVPGGIMVFDDYDVLPGARAAVHDVFTDIEISAQGKARVYFR